MKTPPPTGFDSKEAEFYCRRRLAWTLAILYGGLQGGGMASFALQLLGMEFEADAPETWAVVVPVMAIITWVNAFLVAPDLEEFIADEEYKTLFDNSKKSNEEKIGKKTLAYCTAASLLLGAVVSYGITDLLPAEGTAEKATAFTLITLVLALAEGLLIIKPLARAINTNLGEETKNLFDSYENDDDKARAKRWYYGSLLASLIGMAGIALVGTKCLSNNIENISSGEISELSSMIMSATLLLIAAASQIPFYIRRSINITKDHVPPPATELNEIPAEKLVFKKGSYVSGGLWIANGILNAPCAYLGVVTTIMRFSNIDKAKATDSEGVGATLLNTFCQYGTSNSALATYGVGVLFFVCAVAISMIANSVPAQKPETFEEHKKRQKAA